MEKNFSGEITAQKPEVQSNKFFGTINGKGVWDCEIVDATTVKADGTLFQGPIENHTILGNVQMTDFATGEVLVFNAAEAHIFGVDYYEAASGEAGSHPVQATLWRLSKDIAVCDFNALRDMLVRVMHNTPGSFIEVSEVMGITNLWLWSDKNRNLLLRQVVANFPVQVPEEAVALDGVYPEE